MAEEVVSDLLKRLQMLDVEILQEVCQQLEIQIPPAKAGNKTLLFNLVMRYVHSEEVESKEDEGMSMFLKLNDDLQNLIDKIPLVKIEEVKPLDAATKPRIEVHRLREFKINGSVGSVGQKDTLTYTSLSFQMQQAKTAGYSSKEVFAAVIKAIKPGSNLRNYLESRIDISETAFIQVLRSHFREKDSSSVFHELSNCVQLPSESELDFCLRAMSLRQCVMSLSFEEEIPFDDELVRKRFFHTLSTGFKHNNIR